MIILDLRSLAPDDDMTDSAVAEVTAGMIASHVTGGDFERAFAVRSEMIALLEQTIVEARRIVAARLN